MYDPLFVRLTLSAAVGAALLALLISLRSGAGLEEALIKMSIALVAAGIAGSFIRQAAFIDPGAEAARARRRPDAGGQAGRGSGQPPEGGDGA